MQKVIGGVEDIQPVTYVYVPGFSEIHSPNRWHPIMKRESPSDPQVHVLQRVDGPLNPSGRENAFINASSCPSEEFAEANKTMEPTR